MYRCVYDDPDLGVVALSEPQDVPSSSVLTQTSEERLLTYVKH